jgi:hypothetical protein
MDPEIIYTTDEDDMPILDFQTKRDQDIMHWLNSFDCEKNEAEAAVATTSVSFDELDQIAREIWVEVPMTTKIPNWYDAMVASRTKKPLKKNQITLLLKNWMHQIKTSYPKTTDKIRVSQVMGIPVERVDRFACNFRKRFCVVNGKMLSLKQARA